MTIDQYIPKDHAPNASRVSDLYGDAIRELALPFPSVRFSDFTKLNHMTGGFRAREFSILCGATGVGKTCLLANLSADLLKQRVPQFVASVETGPTDYVKRVLSVIEHCDLNSGDPIRLETLKRLHEKHGGHFETDTLSLSLYDNRFRVEELMADIAWHVKNRGTKIAMIDNLNFFMEVTRAADQLVEMDRVIHELIIFCKRIDVHVIMVMHPKKTDGGRVESEFDVKGSSTAVQEAHNVFLFNRPHPDLITATVASHSDRELKIAKMRRRGAYVGRRLLFLCSDSVSYREGETV